MSTLATKRKNHLAAYNGKVICMDYITDRKREFRLACMRIADNQATGYVLTPKGELYEVTPTGKTARLVKDEEKITIALALFAQE